MNTNYLKLISTLVMMTSVPFISSTAFAATVQQAAPVSNPNYATTEEQHFMQENAKKAGIVQLDNGLQYKVIVKGKGKKPTITDTVVVHYAGHLRDGKEFDSSYKRGEPASFPVSAVIPGWTQALQLMPVGSTWELYIPSKLAYGDAGAPPAIGPNEPLIFKVELLEIKPA